MSPDLEAAATSSRRTAMADRLMSDGVPTPGRWMP
jgi:hypothetical protein